MTEKQYDSNNYTSIFSLQGKYLENSYWTISIFLEEVSCDGQQCTHLFINFLPIMENISKDCCGEKLGILYQDKEYLRQILQINWCSYQEKYFD